MDLGVYLIQIHHFTGEEAKACGGVGESCPGSQELRHLCPFLNSPSKLRTYFYLLFHICILLKSPPPKIFDWSILSAPISPIFLCLPSLPAQGEIWPSLHCVHGSPASSYFMWTWSSEGGPGRPSRWFQWPWRIGFNRAELPRLW